MRSYSSEDSEGLRVALESIRISRLIFRAFVGRSIHAVDRSVGRTRPFALTHKTIELPFRDMAERRMSEIVGEAGRRGHLGLDVTLRHAGRILGDQLLREPPRDLGDLQRVGQAVVEDATFERSDDLRDAAEAPKCIGIETPVTIALCGLALVRVGFVPAVVTVHGA